MNDECSGQAVKPAVKARNTHAGHTDDSTVAAVAVAAAMVAAAEPCADA